MILKHKKNNLLKNQCLKPIIRSLVTGECHFVTVTKESSELQIYDLFNI